MAAANLAAILGWKSILAYILGNLYIINSLATLL